MSKTKVKKKHSTGILVLWCFIMFILGAFAMCGVFYALSEHADVEWRSYIENTLIPNAIAIVTSIGAAIVLLRPIIVNIATIVAEAASKFKQATDDVNASVTSSARSEEEVYKSRQEIASMRAELAEIRELASILPGVAAAVDDTKRRVDTNNKMSKLAFGSMSELVKNGTARQISGYLPAKDVEGSVEEDEGSTEA